MRLTTASPSTLLYPSPAQYNEVYLASLTTSLSHLTASSLDAFLADPSHLPADLFAVLLRLLNAALLPEWVPKLMHVQVLEVIHD